MRGNLENTGQAHSLRGRAQVERSKGREITLSP